MEYPEWEHYYRKIAEDFGYSPEKDAMSGEILAGLLTPMKDICGPGHLRRMISGKNVIIYGPSNPDVSAFDGVKIATDSSVKELLSSSLVPDIIVTDLDGDVPYTIDANSIGSTVLIHAHGDNIPLLRRYVPHFKGFVGGTVQTRALPPLMNFGGFTDGDRAAFIADASGAERIFLSGFDFENPVRKPGMTEKAYEIKKRKLEWARRLISLLKVEMV